tara:strand:+ start:214 stop:603 length:390 start_codon:yes stop_codon:yes gene_type:complete
MSNKFIVEIISPEQTILKKETNEVIIPSYEGQMGILKDHIPLITFLKPGLITIMDDREKKYYVEEGTVEFSNNNLLILSSTVRDLANFDKNSINEVLQEAETKFNSAEISDKERFITAYKIETLKEINQ